MRLGHAFVLTSLFRKARMGQYWFMSDHGFRQGHQTQSLHSEEANSLQFSLTMEVLPLSDLKSAQFIKAVVSSGKTQDFKSLEAMMYGGTLFTIHKSCHCYCPRLHSSACTSNFCNTEQLKLTQSRVNWRALNGLLNGAPEAVVPQP